MEIDEVMEPEPKRARVDCHETVKILILDESPEDELASFTVAMVTPMSEVLELIRVSINWPDMPVDRLTTSDMNHEKPFSDFEHLADVMPDDKTDDETDDETDEFAIPEIRFYLPGFVTVCNLCAEKFLLPYEDDDDYSEYGDDGDPVHRCYVCRVPKIEGDLCTDCGCPLHEDHEGHLCQACEANI